MEFLNFSYALWGIQFMSQKCVVASASQQQLLKLYWLTQSVLTNDWGYFLK